MGLHSVVNMREVAIGGSPKKGPHGVEHDSNVCPDSSQFFKRCGDEKTAILLFKDRTLGLTGDNKILFILEAITTRELDNSFLT